MKTKSQTTNIARWPTSLAAAGLLIFVTMGSADAHPDSVSGEAFGAAANAAGATVNKTPDAVLAPDGGMAAASVISVGVPNVLATDTLTAITSGGISESASAQSLATVEQVNILNGLITADAVVPISSSRGDAITATSDAAGSTLLGLVVNGVRLGDVTPAPNTRIDIPGVGTVILNEQTQSGDGVGTSALTVNMIHVVLRDPQTGTITGDIIVGSAQSGVTFLPFVPAWAVEVPPSPTPCVFYTGGGKIQNPTNSRDYGTFGFNASGRHDATNPTTGGPQGLQLKYDDHHPPQNRLMVHGTDVPSFSETSNPATACGSKPIVKFTGPARVNQNNAGWVDGFSYEVDACDVQEPGVGHDAFRIIVRNSGGDVIYDSCIPGFPACGGSGTGTKNPVLVGGNIQRHVQ